MKLKNNIINEKIIKIFLLTITILILVCSLQGIFAATNTTINSDNATGIKGGIDTTSNGGTLTLQPGTYKKTTDYGITISKNMTIQGNGTKDNVIIDAQKNGRIFTIYNNVTVTFINITFMNGNADYGGAIHNSNSNTSMTFINCAFTNNAATYGGAIYNNEGSMKVSGSTFTQNTAKYNGGAIYNYKCNMNVSGSTFTQNTANSGGGAIYNSGGGFTVSSSTFTQNTANSGGAIHNNNIGILIVGNSTFINNTSGLGGGGAIYKGNNDVILFDCEFINNTERKLTSTSTINVDVIGQKTRISGVLTDEIKKVIANANLTVTINNAEYTVRTESDGSWTIDCLYILNEGDILKITVSWEGNDNCTGFNKTTGFIYYPNMYSKKKSY